MHLDFSEKDVYKPEESVLRFGNGVTGPKKMLRPEKGMLRPPECVLRSEKRCAHLEKNCTQTSKSSDLESVLRPQMCSELKKVCSNLKNSS